MPKFCRAFRRLVFIGGLSALIFSTACGRLSLVPQPQVAQSVSSAGTVCAAPPEQSKRYTKFLFLIDKSGSNQTGNGFGSPGTDPDNSKRAGNIEKFYNKNYTNPYFKWGFIVFHDANADAYVGNSDVDPTFTQDEATFRRAIQRQRSTQDQGATPYRSALTFAKGAIKNDMQAHPEEDSVYMIFMMSDGYPTDGSQPSDVDDVISLSPDRVYLSTAYYGPPDVQPEQRLEEMAKRGRGKYVDLNKNPDFNFDELVVGPTAEPWLIKRLVVYNVNSAFCDDNTIDVDSDGDGLCDKDELRYNLEFMKDPEKAKRMGGKLFDPFNRFSFGGTLSDSFHYKRIVFGELLPSCPADYISDDDMDMATKCEEQYLYNANPQGPTANWTAAMKKSADPLNPDTDGDGFLDLLEFFQFKDKSAALDYTNMTKLYNGMTGEQIMREHRHFRDPQATTPEMAYDTSFKETRVNEQGQNCYTFSQTHLPLYPTQAITLAQAGGNENLAHLAGENVVLVYFIETPEKDPNGKGVMKYSYQKLKYLNAVGNSGIESGVQFTPEIFKTYKIPNTP